MSPTTFQPRIRPAKMLQNVANRLKSYTKGCATLAESDPAVARFSAEAASLSNTFANINNDKQALVWVRDHSEELLAQPGFQPTYIQALADPSEYTLRTLIIRTLEAIRKLVPTQTTLSMGA